MGIEDFVNFGVTLACFCMSAITARLISRQHSFSFLSHREGRYGSIDGLRGFLAISVFYHHFITTYYWKVNGVWTRPPESYFQNYGKVGVALFFMITGFLFISKLIKENGGTNWFKLYESRIFRIYPLYIFSLLLITIVVFSGKHFSLNTSLLEIVNQYILWGAFHGGTINNFSDTNIINAGVDWTLKYEWLFYISLPIISSIIIRFRHVGSFLILILSILLFQKPIQIHSINTQFFILFSIGGFVAFLFHRYKIPKSFMKTTLMSSFTLLVIFACIFYAKTLSSIHVTLISVFFITIVFGNDMFGVFSLKSSILLGEISYSIYLLHGVILYLAFSIFPIAEIRNYSLNNYLIFMPLVTITVIVASAFTFIGIEKPCIDFGRKYVLTNYLLSIKNKYKAL